MKGIMVLRFTSWKTVTLREILYVLEIRKNLVSRSLLCKHGVKVVFKYDIFMLNKHDVFVSKG